MITLICLRNAGDPPPPDDLRVAGDRPVELVEAGPLGAWICAGTLERHLEGVRAHDAVLRTALRSATPLPVRFGTAFAGMGSLLAMLAKREGEFTESLGRVRGKVEMGIRMTWVETPGAQRRAMGSEEKATVTSGREYLEARRRALGAEEALRLRAGVLVEELERHLFPEPFPTVRQLVPGPGEAAVLAHLVQRQGVAEYRARAESARATCSEVTLHLTGPWAPYSFV